MSLDDQVLRDKDVYRKEMEPFHQKIDYYRTMSQLHNKAAAKYVEYLSQKERLHKIQEEGERIMAAADPGLQLAQTEEEKQNDFLNVSINVKRTAL